MEEEQKRLRAEVKRLLEQAETADAEEDARYGRDRSGDEVAPELAGRESRLQRIREAKKALEERAREEAKKKGEPPETAKPEKKDQYNFTDPESRIMKGGDGFVQAYNAQIAVEQEFQLIVGQAVTQAANDKEQLPAMVKTIEQQTGQKPEQMLADSGYGSEKVLETMEKKPSSEQSTTDLYIATGRQKHGQLHEPCRRGPLPKGATRMDRMRRKLQTKTGAAVYASRKGIVEPVFGQIKHVRGFRQFLLRGLEKVRGEWALVCLTHNILKLHRMCYGPS
jgi:hypothetical protein